MLTLTYPSGVFRDYILALRVMLARGATTPYKLWSKCTMEQESCAIAKMTVRYISRSWAVAEIWSFDIIQDGAAILDLFESKVTPLDPPSPKTPPYNQTWSGSDDGLRRYRHLKFFQHGGGSHLGLVQTVNSAVRSAIPENPMAIWYGHLKLSKMAAAAILDLFEPEIAPLDPPSPKTLS